MVGVSVGISVKVGVAEGIKKVAVIVGAGDSVGVSVNVLVGNNAVGTGNVAVPPPQGMSAVAVMGVGVMV